MGKISTKISIFLDRLKDNVIFLLILLLIVIFICTITHNIIRIVELLDNYEGKYKNLVELENGDIVNIYKVGNGERTIVILPGFGTQSPTITYKNLQKRLSENYTVVIVEYPGYGFAKSSKIERNNENLVYDVKLALEKEEIFGPYILMPHSISNIYAMKFIEMYPESVSSVVSLDGEYPANIESPITKSTLKNTINNVKITSILEYTGFARILSYVKPDMYYINLLKQNDCISDKDIKLYRKIISMNYLTQSMIDEIKLAPKNMEEMIDFKYPENLPVLQLLSSQSVKEYDEKYEKNKLEKLAKDVISNEEIQKTEKVNGTHMLNFTALDEVIELTNNFINE